jgi:general secretion pathway protein I
MSAHRVRFPDVVARGRAGGFSLIEVLAAFVILALVGTALFRIFAGALGNASLSDEYSRATLFAESRLASPGVETPLREGKQQGTSEDGKYACASGVSRSASAGRAPRAAIARSPWPPCVLPPRS